MSQELDALKAVVDELSTALADLVHAATEGQANVGEIGSTLAEMLEFLRSRKDTPPQVTVNPTINVPEPKVVIHSGPQSVVTAAIPKYDSDGRLVRLDFVREPVKGD